MISKEKVESLIADKLASGDYFIVSLDVSASNSIKLIIDSMQGISIDECVEFSRAIEHNLDRESEDFELEVSSPGLSTSLKVYQQYVKNIGRELNVLTTDNKKIKGLLISSNEQGIVLEEEQKTKIEGQKKKAIVKTRQNIAFDNIKKALVVIKF
ncbi:MAG: ribosome assembly cofactor RimP [Bacteroidales bacterium]|nr:ribosome assembly cofactor RimP [Bacteroidales bacterium]